MVPNFLISALNGAVPFAEMDYLSVTVTQDLKLDMMRAFNEFLYVDTVISESLFRFNPSRVIPLHEASVVVHSSQSTSASASNGFDHDGIANLLGYLECFLFGCNFPLASRRNRHACFSGLFASRILVPHCSNRIWRGPDKLYSAAGANLRKVGVLRQKSISGMDGIDIADLRRADDAIDLQITFRAWRGSYADGFIRKLHMKRINVRL